MDDTTEQPLPADQTATPDDLVDAARSSLGSLAWKRFGFNAGIPSGEAKDHQFVADTLAKAGVGFDDGTVPAAADWADPAKDIPGWQVVDGPAQAGDVLAMPRGKPDHWYFAPGQQMGIATGDDTTVGVRNNNAVAESDWGFRDDDDPTVRRHGTLIADADTPASSGGEGNNGGQPEDQSPPGSSAPESKKSDLREELRRKREKLNGPSQTLWEALQTRFAPHQRYLGVRR